MLYEAVRHIAGMIIHPLCNVGLKVLFDLRASSERKWAPTSGLFNWLSHDLALAFKFLKLTRNSTGKSLIDMLIRTGHLIRLLSWYGPES